MTTQTDWIYCRLVDRSNFIVARKPFWFGQMELSGDSEPNVNCKTALELSMRAHRISNNSGNGALLTRARLLLLKTDHDEARRCGDQNLAESVRAINAHLAFPTTGIRVTDAGYLFDLRARLAVPFLAPVADRQLGYTMAMLDIAASDPLHILNTLFVAPKAFGELGDAFRRSSYWRELASKAEDESESLLLFWMACECLCKTSRDDQTGTKILAAAGFPTNAIAKMLGESQSRSLTTLPNYRAWRKTLSELVNALRIARNQIVHVGYRDVDLPELLREDQQRCWKTLLPRVAKCLADMALTALGQRCGTVGEMWQLYPSVLNQNGIRHHANWFINRLEE